MPNLSKGDFCLSQTTAILAYLGSQLGYDLDTEEDRDNVLQVACNAADLWNEGYTAKKGSKNIGATTDGGKVFLDNRCGKWLHFLEKNLQAHKNGEQYFFGDTITYD
eukprot:UN27053